MALKLVLTLIAAPVAYGLYRAVRFAKGILTSPLRDLPGPKRESIIWGNLGRIWDTDLSVMTDTWLAEYGPTIAFRGVLNQRHLVTEDNRALSFILSHPDEFQKGEDVRESMREMFGDGLLVVEGDQHRRHRKILNPAFGPAQVRALTDVFLDKAIELRDIWAEKAATCVPAAPQKGHDPSVLVLGREPLLGEARVDVLSWLSRATLDVIGRAGFNYELNALKDDGDEDELAKSFAFILKPRDVTLGFIVRQLVPLVKTIFPSKWESELARARATMNRIGMRLIDEARAEVDKGGGKDLLSLLVKANMREGAGAMSDEEMLAQVPTFLVAGHETTSAAVTWALFALCKHPDMQVRLRAELAASDKDRPTMEELDALEYLDWVVRETMRVHAPVPSTVRTAECDVAVPVERAFVDRKGVEQHAVRMNKGDLVFVPILAVNMSKEIWGEDAEEFRPERWRSVPDAVKSVPGIWSHMLSFIGGPRACIGYRFSLVEMKALVFTLVRAFEFELAVPVDEIGAKDGLVRRPVVLSNPEKASQMPMIVRPAREAAP